MRSRVEMEVEFLLRQLDKIEGRFTHMTEPIWTCLKKQWDLKQKLSVNSTNESKNVLGSVMVWKVNDKKFNECTKCYVGNSVPMYARTTIGEFTFLLSE